MKNSKKGIIVFLLCFCFRLMPYQVMAASTSDAVEPIMPEKECSLTISYCCGETAFSGVEVKLYRIAEVSADFQYTLTQPFEASGLILNGIQTVGEWNVVAVLHCQVMVCYGSAILVFLHGFNEQRSFGVNS